MLEIIVHPCELWNEEINQFITCDLESDVAIHLEHSLISLSKWEQKWHKPFLTNAEKTIDETIDYIKCMTINNVSEEAYQFLTPNDFETINNYISDPMTATWFSENTKSGPGNGEMITNEIIYHWMISLQIPVEFQEWHLNHLLTLIRVCEIKNQPPKKMSSSKIISRNAAINEARRKALNSKG